MFQSMVHIFLNSIEKNPEKDLFRYRDQETYRGISYREAGEIVEDLTCGMAAAGLKAGDKIAILSYNRPEWPLCDFAIFALRGITVPIYHTLPAGQIAHILKDSGARAIFVEDQVQWEKVREIYQELNDLEMVFSFSTLNENEIKYTEYRQLLSEGKAFPTKQSHFFLRNVNEIDPQETCSLVYTSGTTGTPKGVMLNQRGFVINVVNSESVFGINADDVFLSFLPLSHLYERLGGHWCPIYKGATIAYARNISTVVEDIQAVRPTVMVSVPRLYEKISSGVIDQVESGSGLRRKVFYAALKAGRQYHEKKFAGKADKISEMKYRWADRLVFSKIKEKLGGRFRFPISGGAPLSVETLKFFEAIGLQIVEGYGMTETHLIITLTPPGNTKYGSCGKPIPEVEVKIAEDGEILVSGNTLMQGYYNQPELTREIIDEEGRLHTGDIGYLDEDNYLFITDRKKNILVTAGGKNVAPAPIEHAIRLSKYVEDVCLIGNKRRFISALIIPNYEMLKQWAKEEGMDTADTAGLLKQERVRKLYEAEIEQLQADFAQYEKVKKFILLPQPLTVENGELTPSLKIRRPVVEAHFKEEIEALYQ
ncbi:MAG: long-chain fatty acid--CoA ligase [Calditrichia bacterium]